MNIMTKKASDATELWCDNNTAKTHHVTWSCTGLEITSPTFLLDFIRWWAGFGKLNPWQLDWIPIISRDLWVPPPVPTKGACRVAELAFKRFLREQIRLTQRAKGDGKKETEPLFLQMRPVKYLKKSELIPKEYLTPLKIDNNASFWNLSTGNKLLLFLMLTTTSSWQKQIGN